MKAQLRTSFTLFVLLMVMTGIVYPLLVTGIAQLVFPTRANGSLIKVNGQVMGSELIGQDFTAPGFFWGRPSATSTNPYNAYNQEFLTGSSGSNQGPLSQVLVNNVQERVNVLRSTSKTNANQIPVDLVTASASGLDPDISVAAAFFQVPRVARERGLDEMTVIALVDKYTVNRQFGILGEPRVNVLKLNLALEGIQ